MNRRRRENDLQSKKEANPGFITPPLYIMTPRNFGVTEFLRSGQV